MNYDFDHELFLALNFDGGSLLDRAMLVISGTSMWIPLYLLILWLVWHRVGWRNLIVFVVCLGLAMVFADMIAGVFKHTGVLKNLWASFPPRLRPMFAPEMEGLVHFPPEALGGRYGTVSSHAATVVALATISIPIIARRWFTWLMVVVTVLICYSRIYLAKHYPIDIMLGTVVGLLAGFGMYLLYLKLRMKQGSTK